MYDAIGRQIDNHEAIHADDRDVEARYNWERKHYETCPMDRKALVTLFLEKDGEVTPHTSPLPCCAECFEMYWSIEAEYIEMQAAPVIDLHPKRVA